MADIRLDGQAAVVTGAGRGLGRAHALELGRRGARVVVNDAGFNMEGTDSGDPAPSRDVVQEIVAAGGQAVASTHDISHPEQARALVAQCVETFGRIDALVHNAGNLRRATLEQVTVDDVRAVLDVHLVAGMVLCQEAWPHMVRQRHGRIVLTTSQVGFYGKFDSVSYAMAKNGLIGLMHVLKLAAPKDGIGINCISPVALTRMGGHFPQKIADGIAPHHVSAAVSWLCSKECTLNGEIVIAGGGHFARAETVESRGIDVEDTSAEQVARDWDRIADMREPLVYPDALLAVGATFDKVKKRVGA